MTTTDHELSPRLDLQGAAPKPFAALLRLERSIELDPGLRELVKLRASQINGCAYCIDMHSKDARRLGESEQRLYALSAWAQTPFFSGRERAALALCEAVTRVGETHVPAAVWDEAAAHFDPAELGALLFAIVAINAWNRVAIATRIVPGSYDPDAA